MRQPALKVLVVALLALLCVTQSTSAVNEKPPTILSFEGAYFVPRKQAFEDIYGKSLPVVGARVDFGISDRTSLGIRGRYFKMSEIEELAFTDILLGVLLKKAFPENEITDFYMAGGFQVEYRRIKYTPPGRYDIYGNFRQGTPLIQWDIAPSVTVEGGIDLWILSGIKVSPNVGFNYFPFGDPTRGDFGDTGGFMFSVSLGFKL